MDALPLIALAGAAFLFLGKKSANSTNTNSNSDKKDGDNVVISGDIKLITCKPNQFKNNGICEDFWVDNVTDLLVSQSIDALIESKYKGKSWDDMCADKKVNNGVIDFQPNTNSIAIVKKLIMDLWKPVITSKMLPPTNSSPEHIKTIWKRVTAIYFNKVCGLV